MGVGDKKVLVTLQKHLKSNMSGNDIFCPFRELSVLTKRLPELVCSTSLFDKEEGKKKEQIGLACLNSLEAICIDMDRYLECNFNLHNEYLPTNSNEILFKTNTTTNDDGCYVLFGTDHGQGTSQFQI